jgi:hypothetical protein
MTKLHLVGITLADKAKTTAGDVADAFGRSAFNRYYYAAYLQARGLLIKVNPDWDVSHSDAPTLVEKSLVGIVRKEVRRKERSGLISHTESMRITSTVATACTAIAEVLRVAYKVRVISDYKPEEDVMFENETFNLDSHTEGEARMWAGVVEVQKGRILRACKELGLVY